MGEEREREDCTHTQEEDDEATIEPRKTDWKRKRRRRRRKQCLRTKSRSAEDRKYGKDRTLLLLLALRML